MSLLGFRRLARRISDFKFRNSDVGFQNSDFGIRISDFRFWILDFGFQISDFPPFQISPRGFRRYAIRFHEQHPRGKAWSVTIRQRMVVLSEREGTLHSN